MRRSLRLLAPLVVVSFLATGCVAVTEDVVEASGISPETANDPKIPVGPGGALTVEAFEFGFRVSGTAIDGAIAVTLDNVGDVIHNFTIDNVAGDVHAVEAAAHESDTADLLLFGGAEYVFYCSIPGHRAAGMEGVLVVANEGEDGTVEIA